MTWTLNPAVLYSSLHRDLHRDLDADRDADGSDADCGLPLHRCFCIDFDADRDADGSDADCGLVCIIAASASKSMQIAFYKNSVRLPGPFPGSFSVTPFFV